MAMGRIETSGAELEIGINVSILYLVDQSMAVRPY